MAKKHMIAVSANGKDVYTYLIRTEVAAQISRQPHLATLIKEVVSSLRLTGLQVSVEHDMGRTIGYSEMIETRSGDTVFYARQNKAGLYMKFVKNRKADPTSILSIVLERDDDGDYELMNVWIGKMVPDVPGSEKATDKSEAYWADHAIIYNGQPILLSTQTKDCPY